jgi:hypothetical protein
LVSGELVQTLGGSIDFRHHRNLCCWILATGCWVAWCLVVCKVRRVTAGVGSETTFV